MFAFWVLGLIALPADCCDWFIVVVYDLSLCLLNTAWWCFVVGGVVPWVLFLLFGVDLLN